jgi:hypothetical protein
MELLLKDLMLVSGGAVGPNQIIAGVKLALNMYVTTAEMMAKATKEYAEVGRAFSEATFNITHPNPLGKMEYYPSDFS